MIEFHANLANLANHTRYRLCVPSGCNMQQAALLGETKVSFVAMLALGLSKNRRSFRVGGKADKRGEAMRFLRDLRDLREDN